MLINKFFTILSGLSLSTLVFAISTSTSTSELTAIKIIAPSRLDLQLQTEEVELPFERVMDYHFIGVIDCYNINKEQIVHYKLTNNSNKLESYNLQYYQKKEKQTYRVQ